MVRRLRPAAHHHLPERLTHVQDAELRAERSRREHLCLEVLEGRPVHEGVERPGPVVGHAWLAMSGPPGFRVSLFLIWNILIHRGSLYGLSVVSQQ